MSNCGIEDSDSKKDKEDGCAACKNLSDRQLCVVAVLLRVRVTHVGLGMVFESSFVNKDFPQSLQKKGFLPLQRSNKNLSAPDAKKKRPLQKVPYPFDSKNVHCCRLSCEFSSESAG
jgi:hypothetical protein